MSESRSKYVVTFLEDFREEITARTECPEAIVEAWTSQEFVSEEERTAITGALTSTDQLRVLFYTVARGTPQIQSHFYHLLKEKEAVLVTELEQRCRNNKVTQTELTWTQVKPEINIKTKKEQIIRQKQLINEIIRETWAIWKDRHVETEAFHVLNKATRLVKEIEQLWETMEHEENQQKLKMDADKHYVEEMHSQVQHEKSELEQIKAEIQIEKAKLEHDRQVAEEELDELNYLRESLEKQNKELDVKLHHLKMQVREMEVTSTEAGLRKTDLIKTMRMSRRKEEELIRMKEKIEQDTNIQVKWINFQLQKKERHLDQRLERTMRERDELDIMKVKMRRQREELQQRMEDMINKMVTMAQVKDGMQSTVGEMDSTRVEMHEVQKEARENQGQVKRHAELLKDLKVKVDRWVAKENQRQPLVRVDVQQSKDEHNITGSKERAISLEVQREMYEETMYIQYDDETVLNVQEIERIEQQIAQLMDEEETMKGQIRLDMDNMEVTSEDMKQLIKEINELQSPDVESGLDCASAQVETQGLLQKTLHTVRRTLTSIWGRKEEATIIKETDKQGEAEECDSMLLNVEGEYSASDIQRLREELYATVDVIRSVKLELMPESHHSFVEEDFVPTADIEELLQEMREFQEALFAVRDDIKHLQEDLSDIKTFKITARKQRRNLDLRLEKTLRERDELDILKRKVQRQHEALQQKIDKIQRIKDIVERMSKTIRKKSDEFDAVIKENEILLTLIKELCRKSEDKKQDVEKLKLLIQSEWTKMQSEFSKLLHLNKTIQHQTQELDDKGHMTEKEIREMEALLAELEVRRRESEQAFRKARRKEAELENMWNQIREERDSLRKESSKKKKELEQRLEKTRRERDELEILNIKVQRQKEELSGEVEIIRREKERIQNHLELIQQHEEKKTEIGNEMTFLKEFVSYFQSVKRNMDREFEMITVEITQVLKSVKTDWRHQWEESRGLQSESKNLRDKLDRIKSQLQIMVEQRSLQDRSEKEFFQQKSELDFTLQKVQREMREMEVLKSELELKRTQNERVVKKQMKKEQELKALRMELQEEKDALTKRRTEDDQKRESMNRERGKLHETKLQLQQGGNRNDPIPSNELFQKIQMCTEKMNNMRQYFDKTADAFKTESKHLTDQTVFLNMTKEEGEKVKREMRRHKDTFIGVLKLVQEKNERYWSQIEAEIEKEKQRIKQSSEELQKEKEHVKKQAAMLKADTTKIIDTQEEIGTPSLGNGSKRVFKSEKKQVKSAEKTTMEDDESIIKAKTKQEREELARFRETIEKEKSELELMRLDMQLQMNLMEQDKQSIKEEMELLDVTKAEMKNRRQFVDALLDEINCEKGRIKDLSLQISEAKEKVGRIKLTLLEEKDKDEDQDEMKMAVVAETKQLKDLIKTLSVMKAEAEKAIIHIREENEQRNKLRRDVEDKRQMLVQEMKRITEQLPVMKTNVKEKYEEVMRNKNEDIKYKMQLIQREQETVEKLCDGLQKNQVQFERQRIKMVECVDQVSKGKYQLMELMSHVKLMMSHVKPFVSEILERKAELKNTTTNLHQLEEDIRSSLNEIDSEKANLEVLASQVQAQKDTFQSMVTCAGKEKGKSGLLTDDGHVEGKMSELKLKEEGLEMMKIKLNKMTEQICESVKEKLSKLDRQNEELKSLNVFVERTCANLKEQQQQVTALNATLRKETGSTQSVISTLRAQKEQLKSTVHLNILKETKDLEIMKTQLKLEKESLDKEKENMERERTESNVDRELKDTEKTKSRHATERIKYMEAEMDTFGKETHLSDYRLPERMVDMRKVINKMQTVKEQTQRIFSDIKSKMDRIEDLRIMFEQKQSELDGQWKKVSADTEVFRRDAQSLHGAISSMAEREKNVSEEVIHDTLGREFVKSERIMLSPEQVNTLEQIKQSISKEEDELRQTVNQLQENKESISSLLAETSKEKSHIQTLANEVQREKGRFQNILSNVQKKNQGTYQDKGTQTQEEKSEEENQKQDKFGTVTEKCLQLENKMEQLQKDASVLQECNVLEKKCVELDQEKQNIVACSEVLKNEKTSLSGKIFDIIKHIQGKKEELKATNASTEEQSVILKQEQVKSDMNQQYATLRKYNEDITKYYQKLEADKAELQNKKEHVNLLFNEVATEQSNIKDLARDVQNVKKSIKTSNENLQEIQSVKETFDEEKRAFELLKQDLNQKSKETEAAVRRVHEETKKLEELKICFNIDKVVLEDEKDKLNTDQRNLKLREAQLMEDMKIMDKLRQRVKDLKEIKFESKIQNMDKMEKNMQDLYCKLQRIEDGSYAVQGCISRIQSTRFELLSQPKEDKMLLGKEGMERKETQKMTLPEVKSLEMLKFDAKTEMEMLKQLSEDMMKGRDLVKKTKDEFLQQKEHIDSFLHDVCTEKNNIQEMADRFHAQKIQLEKVIHELQYKQTEVESKLRELNSSKELLKAEREQAMELRNDLERKRQEIDKEKQLLQESRTTLQNEKEQLEDQIKAFNCKREAIETAMSFSEGKLKLFRQDKQQEPDNLRSQEEIKEVRQGETEMNQMKEVRRVEELEKDMDRRELETNAAMRLINEERQQLEENRRQLHFEREEVKVLMAQMYNTNMEVETATKLLEMEKEQLCKTKDELELQRQEIQHQQDKLKYKQEELKQQEQELLHKQLETQIKELHSSTVLLQAERQQVEVLWKDLERKRQETDAARSQIHEEKQQLQQIRAEHSQNRQVEQQKGTEVVHKNVDLEAAWKEIREQKHQLNLKNNTLDMDRLKLQKQQEQMETELKTRQEQLIIVRENLSQLKVLLQHKKSTLQLHIQDVDTLRQQLTALDQDRDKMDDCTQLLERHKDNLKDTLSLFIGQKQQLVQERQHVETVSSEVTQQRQELEQEKDKMDREKENLQKLRNVAYTFMSRLGKLSEDNKANSDALQMTKNELLKKTEQTDLITMEIKRVKMFLKDLVFKLKSRQDSLDEMKQEVCVDPLTPEDAALVREEDPTSVSEQLTQTILAQERDMFLAARKQREEDLEMREEELASKTASMGQLSIRLKQLTQQSGEAMVKKIQQLDEDNNNVLKLCFKLEKNCARLDEEKNRMMLYSELLQREMVNLTDTSSNISRRPIKKEAEEAMKLEGQTADKTTQTDEFEPIRPDFRKCGVRLQDQTQDLKAAIEFLENTLEALQRKRSYLSSTIGEIKMENTSFKQMAASVRTSKEQLETLRNMLQVSGRVVEVQELEFSERGQNENLCNTQTKKESYLQIEASAITDQTRTLQRDHTEKALSKLKEILLNLMAVMNGNMLKLTSKEQPIELKQEQISTVSTVLKKKIAELNTLKEDLASYGNVFEMEKTALVNILKTNNDKVRDEKQDLEKLQYERTELESLRETVEKECGKLEALKSDVQDQNELLQKTKQDLKDAKNAELLNKEERLQEDMEHLSRMKESVAMEKAELVNEKQQFKVKLSLLESARKSMEDLSVKFKHWCSMGENQVEENMQRIKLNDVHMLQLSRDLERKCAELKKMKHTIVIYSHMIHKEKTKPNLCDRALQTEALAWKQGEDVAVPESVKIEWKQDGVTQTHNLDTQFEASDQYRIKTKKSPRKGLAMDLTEDQEWQMKQSSQSLAVESLTVSANEQVYKKDYLRQLWKETTKERKEIDHMKQRGQQLKNNLEKRIKHINTFVKRPWMRQEKNTSLTVERKTVEDHMWQYSQEQDSKVQNEKLSKLEQLQLRTLSEIEKINVQEKQSRTLKTRDKANQTSQLDSFTEQVNVGSTSEEAEARVADRSTGLLCQIQHYCYSCCCVCCACCQQGRPGNNNNNKLNGL